ncbi:MAG: SpaH/EbpB family LPXTG-anchored major pilin [Oscillospiraceae bacterium]|nr:SpaH/EbpB family LPXTG-anchored major pilin [Oscillospiraceae bacterium]
MKRFFSLLLALTLVCSLTITAWADPFEEAVIDTTRTGSVSIYKYDLTNAEKDGVWDSSYVSTGVQDVNGVETILGSTGRVSPLNANGDAYGYALKGVEFSYLKVADLKIYTMSEDGEEHVELLYGIIPNTQNNAFLSAIGVSANDRYAAADEQLDGEPVYYFRSDVLIDGLKNALASNATVVKNALENYVVGSGGTRMAPTDAYGHTAASELPLGLYLFVETKVPEMVTETTAPFLVSVPMTAANGTNASDGGTRWIYDITLYPKNLTGIPSLEKTLREAKSDTGKNGGSSGITDGYAHTGTASAGDVIEYQIISTLPSITSASTYLSDYTFVDTLSKGLAYKKGDVVLEFFKDAACATKITTWAEGDGKFAVTYNTAASGDSVMTIEMTADGLNEINASRSVYTGEAMVNSGYSDCTLRITYAAVVKPDASFVYGDAGNSNEVALRWSRTNTGYYDTLIDDAHVFSYGIDLTKRFSDNQGDLSKVEFVLHNDTDNYFVKAALNASEGAYYVTGHATAQGEATHFTPASSGKLLIKGLEDDTYTLTEVRTDNAYTLLKDNIKVIIAQAESNTVCAVYGKDAVGVIQNDPRYANVPAGSYNNMPQKHLEHKLLTATAKVDRNSVNMSKDGESNNAFAVLTVINTRGFDLPQTGSYGNWMFPVIGLSGFALAMLGMVLISRKKKATNK